MLPQVDPPLNYQQEGAHVGMCDGVVGWVGVERCLPHGSLLVLLHVARQLRETFGS